MVRPTPPPYSFYTVSLILVLVGAASQSITIATAYDSLGEEGVRHSLIQTQSESIFTNPSLLPLLKKVLAEAKDVKNIIYDTDAEVKLTDVDELKAAFPYINILSFEDLRKLGEDNHVEPVPPTPDDMCCIMYTSGSTGAPKGVPLRHRNVVAASKYPAGGLARRFHLYKQRLMRRLSEQWPVPIPSSGSISALVTAF